MEDSSVTAPNSDVVAGRGASSRQRTLRRGSVLAAAIIAAVLVLAACGGGSGGSPNARGSTNSQLFAFSRCVRSNGVSRFPDPDSSGALPKETPQQLGVSSSQFQAAQSACRHLLPNGGSGPTQAEVQQMSAQGLRFAQCMRNHGVSRFPDPASSGRIPDPASLGIDQGSSPFQAANQACQNYRPPYFPSNADYNRWASTHGS
jgi:hypothetical protein